jgi:hypothetical protein
MGNLLKRLSKTIDLDPEFKERILKAKARRDYLSHHYFRERAEEMMTRSGVDKMIVELEDDQALFGAVDKELNLATKAIREALGIQDEWLDAHFRKYLEQIERGEANRI